MPQGVIPGADERSLSIEPGADTIAPIMLKSELHMGGLTIPNRVLLAPLAGVSDLPFRRICVEMGAGLTYIEMLSARTLMHGSRASKALLHRHPSEILLGAQLTGPSPDLVAEAVTILEAFPLDTIDLNMGCPVKKIVSKNSGSAILKDPDRISRTVEGVMQRTERPVTAKIRLGFDRHTRNVEEVVRRLAAGGVKMISIHGRSREDRYDVPVDYEGIADGVRAVRAEVGEDLPVIGNGDVMDAASAREMMERTGCDAVMISRGVLGNPWIFEQILNPAAEQPTVREWRCVLMRHLAYHCEHYGTGPLDIIPFRKQLLWYTSGFPGMRRLRDNLGAVNHPDIITEMVDQCLADTDPDTRRYASSAIPGTPATDSLSGGEEPAGRKSSTSMADVP
jgi:nifR3 family TIM-barrel protein